MHLELCILTDLVALYTQPPTNITSNVLENSAVTTGLPNPTSPSAGVFTCLLSGPLDDFLFYSGQEHSKWLIDMAHDICDPALKRGTLKVWVAAGEMWKNVNPTDPLTASTYVYDTSAVVSLAKISRRLGRSRTTATGNGSTMANRVKQRDDQRCWVTRATFPILNSHICPKRLGDDLLHVVYSTFVSTPPPPALSIFDEMCGISLHVNLDPWFCTYELGLRCVAPGEYECHSFATNSAPQGFQHTVFGTTLVNHGAPPIHGHRATPPQPHHPGNPPPGLFRWHYLQCVIRKFAHSDYTNLQNILYSELPLRMKGDSDSEDEGTDSDYEWPSAAMDRGQAMETEIEHREAREKDVAEWVSEVQ